MRACHDRFVQGLEHPEETLRPKAFNPKPCFMLKAPWLRCVELGFRVEGLGFRVED